MMHLISHIHWKCTGRTQVIIVLGVLYVIAGLISSFDFSGKTSSVFCGLLTVGISLASWWMAIKAYFLAKKIEKADKWLCTCCCRDSAKQVMLGYIFIMGVLGALKLWSVTDLFVDHWAGLPVSYHAQSWVYLSQNTASIIMAYIIIGVFEAKYRCAQQERIFINTDVKCEDHL